MMWLLIGLVSLLSCASQLCQKQAVLPRDISEGRRYAGLWIFLSLILLAFAMLIWLLVLQRVDVGLAYPMLSLNLVLVTLAAHKIWKEPLSRQHLLGMGLVIVGILLLGYRL